MFGRKNRTKQNSLRAPYGTLSAWFYLLNRYNMLIIYKFSGFLYEMSFPIKISSQAKSLSSW